MKQVKRHKYTTPNEEWSWGFTLERWADMDSFLSCNIVNSASFFDYAVGQAARAEHLGKSREEMCKWLDDAVKLGQAVFRAGARPRGTTTTIRVAGLTIDVPSGPHTHTSAIKWIDIWGVARSRRHQATLDVLFDYDPELIAGAGSMYAGYNYELMFAFRTIERGNWDCTEACERALHMMDTETHRMPKALPLARGTAHLMLALSQRNEANFNSALYGALVAHKAFLGSRSNRVRIKNLLSPELLGLCSVAHDLGFQIDVTSDYIPRWLYTNELPAEARP